MAKSCDNIANYSSVATGAASAAGVASAAGAGVSVALASRNL